MDEQNMQPEKNSVGPLIGSIIVIVILVLGAIYFWGGKLNATKTEGSVGTVEQATNENIDLESDLTNIPEIDVDLNSI
jgi:flagellar basal body-associated protein FliL